MSGKSILTAINFISWKDTGEDREMYTTSDNVKFTSYNDVMMLLANFLNHFFQYIKII